MADNLEQQFQELEDAARRQEDFIGSFAHELKTPLTSMRILELFYEEAGFPKGVVNLVTFFFSSAVNRSAMLSCTTTTGSAMQRIPAQPYVELMMALTELSRSQSSLL